MMRPLYALVVLAIVLLALAVTAPEEPKKEEPPLPVQRSVECRWRRGPIFIDGKINEAAWEGAVIADRSPSRVEHG